MKDYNHEIKVLNDLKNRHANIECHGGYGNNPSVTMLSRTSVIYKGFIKNIDVKFLGEDANGEKQFERTLIIDSEYGHEIKLPYEKIIGMTILSSAEQASLESYLRGKQTWEDQIKNLNEKINSGKINEESLEFAKEMIDANKYMLENGESLIAKGVKTFK